MLQSKSMSIYSFWIKLNLLSCFHNFFTMGHSLHLPTHSLIESTSETFLKNIYLIFSQPDANININTEITVYPSNNKFTNSSPCWEASKISMETFNFLRRISRSTWSNGILYFFSSLCIFSVLDLSPIVSRHSPTSQQAFKLWAHTFRVSVFVGCPIIPAAPLLIRYLTILIWPCFWPWNCRKLDIVLPFCEVVVD